MTVCAVALPEEFDELVKQLEDISKEKHQSISRTIRDILCESLNFTPTGREIKKRNMFVNKGKKD